MSHEGMMGSDGGGETSDGDAFVARNDRALEPEIVRWLSTYAAVADDRGDAAVAAIFDEVNRLLRRYREADAVHRADDGSHLRKLTEHLPVMLWTTDAGLRVTTFSGGPAAADIDPSGPISLPLAVVLGTDPASSTAVDAHERALQGHPAVFEFDGRSRSYLAHVRPLSESDGAIVGTIGLAIDVSERTRAEEALAQCEQQLADGQRLARIGSWDWHAGDAVATWSDGLYRIWGLDPRTFRPTVESIQSRVHPNDRAAYHAVRDAAIRTGRKSEGEFRIIRPDDEVRHLSVLVTATCDADGQPVRVHGVCQDITERKQADEAVRATKRMLEHLLERFPNGAIGVLDADLRYVMAAGRVLTEMGLTPENMIGKTYAELYPSEVVAAVEEPFRRALAGETVTADVPLGDLTYTLSAAPLDQVDGAVRTIVTVAQDMTERVRAERALARREAQLAEAQRLARLGSWERDIATGRLTWSDELYRIYGMAPQEIPASFEAFLAHVHPDDISRVRAINEAAVRSGQSFEYQARILRPDGEVHHYHSRGGLLRDASGRPSRVVGVVQDATERVRAEEARALARERQARLDGMLFVVRDLASRVTRTLAAVPEAGDVSGPNSTHHSSLEEALDAAAALSRALDAIAELQPLGPPE